MNDMSTPPPPVIFSARGEWALRFHPVGAFWSDPLHALPSPLSSTRAYSTRRAETDVYERSPLVATGKKRMNKPDKVSLDWSER